MGKDDFLKYSFTTTEYMFELIRQKIHITHISGLNVLIVMLKNCGDHKHFKIMDILGREATTLKFTNLQKDCFDLLLLYLKQQSDLLKSNKEYWSKLIGYTKKGVNDNADIRNSALALLAQIEYERPKLVKDIISKMNAHLKKRYDSEYKLGSNPNKSEDDEKKQSKPKKTKNPKSPKTSKPA